MQTLKFSVAICVCALGVTLNVCAEDNPAQAAARAAIMAQLNETNNQPTNAPDWSAVPAAAETFQATDNPAQAAARAAVLAQLSEPAAQPTNAPVAPAATTGIFHPADNPAQAAARVAVLAQLQETAVQPTPAPIAPVAPIVAKPVAASTNSPIVIILTAPNSKPAPVVATAPAPTPAPVVVKTPAPAALPINANPGFHPIVAPALPISDSQAARLAALDAQYKADQVSPQDYFARREAILNGQ